MTENTQQSERDVRIQKIQKMKELWVKPYAQHFNKKDLIEDIIKQYSEKEFRDINNIIPNPEQQVVTAGRLILYRSFGKLSFGTIVDSTEKIQIMFHRDNCKMDISTSANEPKLVDSLWEWENEMSAYKFMEKWLMFEILSEWHEKYSKLINENLQYLFLNLNSFQKQSAHYQKNSMD